MPRPPPWHHGLFGAPDKRSLVAYDHRAFGINHLDRARGREMLDQREELTEEGGLDHGEVGIDLADGGMSRA